MTAGKQVFLTFKRTGPLCGIFSQEPEVIVSEEAVRGCMRQLANCHTAVLRECSD